MEYLFNWLQNSDEPLTYLWGRGGSGKTTIAHEFCSIVKRFGSSLSLFNNDSLDLVIYLSAKEKSFATIDSSIVEDDHADFFDERSLYTKILNYSGLYTGADKLDESDLPKLKRMTEEFFNEFSCLIVMDDIDTLTTKNVEVGTSYINRVLGRSKRTSKVLCTQRDAPAHAISNSKEVPGLSIEGELHEFIKECCGEYDVMHPASDEIARLVDLSGRRPLVVQYIIALRRTCTNYDGAFRLYEGDTGDSLRDYVFQREWSSLRFGQDSRSMLATLSSLSKAASFEDLSTILQYGEGRLKDAIAATRAMFLQVNTVGRETIYSLDPITKAFVAKESSQLTTIGTIRARVKNFEKSYFPEIPQISRIGFRVDELLRKAVRTDNPQLIDEAWAIVNDKALTPGVREHPQFKSVYGSVACRSRPPKLDDARSAFNLAIDMNYEPPAEHLRVWFEAERNSGIGFAHAIRICDLVINGRAYDEQTKIDFSASKATTLFHRGHSLVNDEPVQAAKHLIDAIKTHAKVYRSNLTANDPRYYKSERYLRNTAYVLFQHSCKNFPLDEICNQLFEILKSGEGYLDPIQEAVSEILGRIQPRVYEASILHKTRKIITSMSEMDQSLWLDPNTWALVRDTISTLNTKVGEALKRGK